MTWPAALQALDERLLLAVHGWPAPLVPVFHVATVVGGGWGLLALLPFAVRAATRAVTARLFLAVAVTSGVVSLLKALVGRVRPCDTLAWCAPLGVASPGGGSFPSGHAAGSFVFAAFVTTLAPRWAPLAFAWAAVVALSRCVLGVHYPSDVVGGALLGTVVGVAFGWWARRRAHAPAAEGTASA